MRFAAVLTVLLLWSAASADARVRRAPRSGGWQTFRATAYSVEGETATGKQTREGRTVAADPRILPMGTRIEVTGAGPYSGVYVVHDKGPAIKGREIDFFIDNPREARLFGKKTVRVRVLSDAPVKEARRD